MESLSTRIGELFFTHSPINGYPTDETSVRLYNELDFQRACQAYLWGLPIVAFAQWQKEHEEKFGAKSGDIVYYPTYASKLGLLTANATTPYAVSFIRLAAGPIVVEMPDAEVRGAMHNMWQISLQEMTKPGKYLFHAPDTLPPSTTKDYTVVESSTNNIFFGIRLMADHKAKREEALGLIKIYPFNSATTHPETIVITLNDEEWQGWQPRGLEYFERLDNILRREPVDERDRFFHAMLKPLGIGKGEGRFQPDDRQRKILTEAAVMGEAMAKANDFNKRVEAAHYHDGSHWEIATVCPTNQRWEEDLKNYEALDGRAAWFYEAVTNDPAMQSTTPHEDQIYLGAYKDSDGDWLDGAQNYRLHVLPNVPFDSETGFWSITVYDVSTRALINNPQQIGDKSSKMKTLKENDDGSVDIYIGPVEPPEMEKKRNWIPTVPERGAWFAYFRFYSPTEDYFDRIWVLPDIEKTSHIQPR